jgi:hypothetical protein
MILKLTIWLKRGIKYDLNWNSGGSGGGGCMGGGGIRLGVTRWESLEKGKDRGIEQCTMYIHLKRNKIVVYCNVRLYTRVQRF